jgi:hypothetical protein
MHKITHKCIFLDIDGCIFKHNGSLSLQVLAEAEVLEGVKDKLDEWDRAGYTIVLTTGRRESLRDKTVRDLAKHGIFYDNILFGMGRGQRVVINDMKPDLPNYKTAKAINLPRNKGIGDIKL